MDTGSAVEQRNVSLHCGALHGRGVVVVVAIRRGVVVLVGRSVVGVGVLVV